jgi:IS30 family transposase
LSSPRGVKKGPGRRPQSAKRQGFIELRARGWSVRPRPARSVCRGLRGRTGRVGTRSIATVWWLGSSRRWIGWRSVRSVCATCPRTSASRSPICVSPVLGVRAIAGQRGRAPSTIERELRRNAVTGRGYRPFDAHRRATVRRARRHRRRIDINSEISGVVAELLLQRWSPQQMSRHLRLRFVDDPSMWLCHESIYQAVYQPNSRFLRPSRLAPHRRSPLRTGRDQRRAHQRQQRRRPRFEQPMLTIHDRPFPVDDRATAGHWESQWCCQAA